MSGIIKEALADAKTVVSATEERAKDMFIKEFSPKLKSMLASVINEEVSTGADQPGGYNPETDQDAIGVGADGTPNKNINKNAGDGPEVTYEPAKDVKEEGELDIEDDDEVVMEQDDDDLEDADEPVLEGEDELELGDEDEVVEEIGDETEIAPEDDEVLEIVDDEESLEDEPVMEIEMEDDDDEEALMEALKKRNKKLAKENKQLREAVGVLRNKFKKVDLFNAKLAYAFKLMTQPGLTRSEKKQIAENFDAAKTVREAGLIYKTLKTRVAAKAAKNPMRNVNVKGVISESTQAQGPSRLQELAGL